MKQRKSFLFFTMGGTNVGKTTFLETVKKAYPEEVHLVEVGKILRAKYPPGYFQGQGNPAHTQKEAIELCFSGIREGEEKDARFIFVDGQPRDAGQAMEIMRFSDCNVFRERATIELVCPRKERAERAALRDAHDPDKLRLAMDRLDRDILHIHEVLLVFTRYPIHRFNTAAAAYSPLGAFQTILREYKQLDLYQDRDGASPL